jgi:hypothetical protein
MPNDNQKKSRASFPTILLGAIIGMAVGAAMQWLRDGGVVQGISIGLMLGVVIAASVAARNKQGTDA